MRSRVLSVVYLRAGNNRYRLATVQAGTTVHCPMQELVRLQIIQCHNSITVTRLWGQLRGRCQSVQFTLTEKMKWNKRLAKSLTKAKLKTNNPQNWNETWQNATNVREIPLLFNLREHRPCNLVTDRAWLCMNYACAFYISYTKCNDDTLHRLLC